MLVILKKSYIALIACAVVVTVLSVSLVNRSAPVTAVPVTWDTIVLDAGHGGMS